MGDRRSISHQIGQNVVLPIPPSYHKDGSLDKAETSKYVQWLDKSGVKCIMTTAGTSQFNLLSEADISALNRICYYDFDGYKILGIPPLSLQRTLDFIRASFISDTNFLDEYPKTCLLIMYPERYYGNDNIIDFFYKIADESPLPIMIHGMFMRHATGGTYDYTAELINQILKHDNIIGIKEETSELNKAYNVCMDVNTDDNVVVAAGGSMRRFNALSPTGIQTWLGGVSNMFPDVELAFRQDTTRMELIQDFENPMFKLFMAIGWHRAMRYAMGVLGLGCKIQAKPFPYATKHQDKCIDDLLGVLKEKCSNYGFSVPAELTT